MISNQDYFYKSLPSRFRRDDKDLFLKRYLQFVGSTLDDYDEKYDNFFENINPATAEEQWVEFWLRELFGWSWFPKWFTLVEKRRLYGNFARHLARRGTVNGMRLWLADFNIKANIYNRSAFYGEMVWGENRIFVSEPLVVVVEIKSVELNVEYDISAIGGAAWGESFYTKVLPLFTRKEVHDLLRFVQPQGQELLLIQTKNGDENYFFRSN